MYSLEPNSKTLLSEYGASCFWCLVAFTENRVLDFSWSLFSGLVILEVILVPEIRPVPNILFVFGRIVRQEVHRIRIVSKFRHTFLLYAAAPVDEQEMAE